MVVEWIRIVFVIDLCSPSGGGEVWRTVRTGRSNLIKTSLLLISDAEREQRAATFFSLEKALFRMENVPFSSPTRSEICSA